MTRANDVHVLGCGGQLEMLMAWQVSAADKGAVVGDRASSSV